MNVSDVKTFEQWQQFARTIGDRAKALQHSIHDRGWSLAATVEIPHCGCCLHNASIDDNLSGWCYQNPERLKVAKRAAHILADWSAYNLGDRLINKAWNNMAMLKGWCHDTAQAAKAGDK